MDNNINNMINLHNTDIILNPVENIPLAFGDPSIARLQGLYITDKNRTDAERKNAKILFAGRDQHIQDVLSVYNLWKQALSAQDITMRPLSGLNAHLLMFLGLGNIGDKVMLLPEKGGGHFSTAKILNRLGYKIVSIPLDISKHTIDIPATIALQKKEQCKFLFIDRSEGLMYEDFTELCTMFNGYRIFDASQYLTNIIFGEFKSPFEMGFDMIISTLHKNFPGPQKALICTNDKERDEWKNLMNTLYDCVSNIHADKIIQSGIILQNPLLQLYSNDMLENAVSLEYFLKKQNVNVISRDKVYPATHHLWVVYPNKDCAYTAYKNLESCGILTNYRLLPYDIGYGLRLGTNCATIQGLSSQNVCEFAFYFAQSAAGKGTPSDTRRFIYNMIQNSKYGTHHI